MWVVVVLLLTAVVVVEADDIDKKTTVAAHKIIAHARKIRGAYGACVKEAKRSLGKTVNNKRPTMKEIWNFLDAANNDTYDEWKLCVANKVPQPHVKMMMKSDEFARITDACLENECANITIQDPENPTSKELAQMDICQRDCVCGKDLKKCKDAQ